MKTTIEIQCSCDQEGNPTDELEIFEVTESRGQEQSKIVGHGMQHDGFVLIQMYDDSYRFDDIEQAQAALQAEYGSFDEEPDPWRPREIA